MGTNTIKQMLNAASAAKLLKNLGNDQEVQNKSLSHIYNLLGKERGLYTKIVQTLELKDQSLDINELQKVSPIPNDKIEQLINELYPNNDFHISSEGITASLSQVHKVESEKLGTIAIKIKYPDINEQLNSQFRALKLASKGASFISDAFLNLNDHISNLSNTVTNELDYIREIEIAEKIKDKIHLPFVSIPNYFSDLSTNDFLVMKWMDGDYFDENLKRLNSDQRKELAKRILRLYLDMLFNHYYIQTDPNQGNFLYNGINITLLDFGSVIELEKIQTDILLYIIDATINEKDIDFFSSFIALGFDKDKLSHIAECLPFLCKQLFYPFTCDYAVNIKDWDLKGNFEKVLGKDKMWFRSSGPTYFFNIIRSFFYVLNTLKKLDTTISWKFILNDQCKDKLNEARSIKIDEVYNSFTKFSSIAKSLRVLVKENEKEKVNITLPISAMMELETIISKEVLDTLNKNGLDLNRIIKRATKNGCRPQELFTLDKESKNYKVWIE